MSLSQTASKTPLAGPSNGCPKRIPKYCRIVQPGHPLDGPSPGIISFTHTLMEPHMEGSDPHIGGPGTKYGGVWGLKSLGFEGPHLGVVHGASGHSRTRPCLRCLFRTPWSTELEYRTRVPSKMGLGVPRTERGLEFFFGFLHGSLVGCVDCQ